jgi:putative transposase
MRDCLNREGFPVNRKRVQRLMHLMGLESVAPKPNTSKRRCMDNIFTERLWRSVKYEKIFLEEFETVP